MNALLTRLESKIQAQPPGRIVVLSLLYVACVAVLDRVTPVGISLTFFYFPGIILVSWCAGRIPGLALCLLASILIAVEQYLTAPKGPHLTSTALTNGVTRFLLFGVVSWLTLRGRRVSQELNRLVEERTRQWRAEAEEHQATSRRLAETLERFEQVTSNINEVFWLTDVSKKKLIYVSPAYERTWGKSCAALYENPDGWLEDIHPDDREKVRRAAFHDQVDGKYNLEYRLVLPNRGIRWVQDRAFPVRNEKGEVYRIAGIAQDITDRTRAMQDLQHANEHIAHILTHNPATAYTCAATPPYSCTYMSRNILDHFGYEPDEFLEDPKFWVDRVHPDDLEHALASAARTVNSGESVGEYRFRHQDGSYRWVLDHSKLARNEHLGCNEILGFMVDITERKVAEQALQEAERRHRDLLQNIPAVTWSSREDGKILYVSDNVGQLFGIGSMDLRTGGASAWLDRIHPEDVPAVRQAYHALWDTRTFDVEYRFRSHDHRWVWVNDRSITVFQRDGLRHAYGVFFDITGRKEAELARRESETRLRAIVSGAPLLLLAGDAKTVLTFEDGQGLNDLGFVPGTHLGKPLAESYSKFPALCEALQRALGGEQFRAILQLGKHTFDCWCSPNRDRAGVVDGFIGVATNITERQRLEKQILEISDREQARIGQDIHDGLCQKLVSLAFDANLLKDQLERTRSPETTLAGRLVDLLDSAISESRQVSRGLFPIRLDAEGLSSALAEMATSTLDRFGVDCRFRGTAALASVAKPVATHLYRIAQEAISNAVKHSDARRVDVTIDSREGQLWLCIADDGKGLPHISRRNPAGMGLHIMNYRARSIGGELRVESRPGGGTRICCCLAQPAS
jgi:PAS domain S-box-containing protein